MPAKEISDSVYGAPSEVPSQSPSAPHHAESGAVSQPIKRENGDYTITPAPPAAAKLHVVPAPLPGASEGQQHVPGELSTGALLTAKKAATATPEPTTAEFAGLTEAPAVAVWLAGITSQNTRRAYQGDLRAFIGFCGTRTLDELRGLTRSHVLSWREALETSGLAPSTIRRKLSAISSLYAHLSDENAVEMNPLSGVKRPAASQNEGKTPALSTDQARRLLQAPRGQSLKAVRDRAILATYIFHALRRSELTGLTVGCIQERSGVPHLTVEGEGAKTRYLPVHPAALAAIQVYLEAAGHGADKGGALFRPVRNPRGDLEGAVTGRGLNKMLKRYARTAGIQMEGLCLHALRVTAATNALENGADLAFVQSWLGHANVSTTMLYDRRRARPEDSPTFKLSY